jgi:hypothetical protein
MGVISELFDLYEFPGYIAKTDSHQALRLVFVPMPPMLVARIDSRRRRMHSWDDHILHRVLNRILEWDLIDRDGEISFPNYIALSDYDPTRSKHGGASLRAKIVALIRGDRPNDSDPDGKVPQGTAAAWLAGMRQNLIGGLRTQLAMHGELADRGQMMLGYDERVYTRRDRNAGGEVVLDPVNAELVSYYHRFKTCGWASIPESWKWDPLLTDSFAVIDRIYKEHERHEVARAMSAGCAQQQSFL